MTTETVRLFGWVPDFTDCATTVRARLFGEMVTRAIPVVKQYHSDLYHDGQWLAEYVNGPTSFDFLVRECGTNLGDSARVMHAIDTGDSTRILYRVTLTVDNRGEWSATFTEIGN